MTEEHNFYVPSSNDGPLRKVALQKSCIWKQVDTEHMPDTWQADCGAMWTFTDGGPQDNGMNFCPKCGKPLTEQKHE